MTDAQSELTKSHPSSFTRIWAGLKNAAMSFGGLLLFILFLASISLLISLFEWILSNLSYMAIAATTIVPLLIALSLPLGISRLTARVLAPICMVAAFALFIAWFVISNLLTTRLVGETWGGYLTWTIVGPLVVGLFGAVWKGYWLGLGLSLATFLAANALLHLSNVISDFDSHPRLIRSLAVISAGCVAGAGYWGSIASAETLSRGAFDDVMGYSSSPFLPLQWWRGGTAVFQEYVLRVQSDLLPSKSTVLLRTMEDTYIERYRKGEQKEALELAAMTRAQTAKYFGELSPDALRHVASSMHIRLVFGETQVALQLAEEVIAKAKTLKRRELLPCAFHLQYSRALAASGRRSESFANVQIAVNGLDCAHLGDESVRLNAIEDLANLYLQDGRRREAYMAATSLLSEAKRVGASKLQASHLLGKILFEDGRTTEAFGYLDEAFSYSSRLWGAKHPRSMEIASLAALAGTVSGIQGDYVSLLAGVRSALGTIVGQSSPLTLEAALHHAKALAWSGRYQEAFEVDAEIFDNIDDIRSAHRQLAERAELSLARDLILTGQFDDAITFTRVLMEVPPTATQTDDWSQSRLLALSRYLAIAEGLAGAPQAGFERAEEAKSQLLGTLRRAGATLASDEEQIRALTHALFAAERRLAFASGHVELRLALEAARIEAYEALRKALARPIVAQPRGLRAGHEARWSQRVRNSLGPNDVLLSYVIEDGVGAVFVVTKEGFQAHRIHAGTKLEADIRRLQTAIAVPPAARQLVTRSDTPLRTQLAEISTQVIPAGMGSLSGRTITVSLDKVMYQLPFEALLEGNNFLAEVAEVSYVSSFHDTGPRNQSARAKLAPASNRKALLVVAASDYEQSAETLADARRTETSRTVVPTDLRAVAEISFGNLPNLPGTTIEAKGVQRAWGGAETVTIADPQSKASRLMEMGQGGQLAEYKFLLFAVHGLNDWRDPRLSALVFPRGGSGETFVVTAADIATFQIEADVVFLSACSTGAGSPQSGEGLIGFPLAFMQAGARNVIVTRWQIADQIAAQFSPDFFAAMRTGSDPKRALSEARRILIRTNETRDPFFWAPYVLFSG